MFEAEFTHEGDRCTFEVLLQARRPATTRRSSAIAEIVHDIDLKDGKFGREEAAGIKTLIAGIAAATATTSERLARGARCSTISTNTSARDAIEEKPRLRRMSSTPPIRGTDGQPRRPVRRGDPGLGAVAALSFGGPAGQIAVMHRILVEEKRWIGENRFLHALNYCMLLPGPEAQQLAVYIGWLMHRTVGGLVAGILFVLPGCRRHHGAELDLRRCSATSAIVQALFFGLKAAVLAIVLEAVVRIGRRALKNRVMVGLAAAAFVAIFVFDVPFPIIVLVAGLIGFVGGRAGVPGLSWPAAVTARSAARQVADADSAARRGDARACPPAAALVAEDQRGLPGLCGSGRSLAARADAGQRQRLQPDRRLLLARWRW